MKQRSLIFTATAVLMLMPQPLGKTTSRIELRNPEPIPNYTARTTRAKPRHQLTLNQLPDKWQRLAWCESRDQLHANNNNTYYGLWQIHKGWFKPFGINPKTATLTQQFKVAKHVYERQGSQAWSCANKSHFK